MAKSYSPRLKKFEINAPKKETIDFLLRYSRALQVIQVNKLQIQVLLN
ncbi:hypothetical protein [Flavobacterium sp. HSC-61S13]|nr:hypothetical protein [Flavobacterium sp. HSC-61S13]MCP1994518.1 hypothetical protein [Flavobacterium sp. HSC-61S13]